MRRADRLFQIVQLLRHDRVVTARMLAQELEVSERTIYRDIQDLSLSGVPIEGEAGVGYRLMKGFHLPPLMFTEEELSALLLGARMVQAWSDQGLALAAQHLIKKVESVVPEHLKLELVREDILVPDFENSPAVSEHLQLLRQAIKHKNKVYFHYRRADGELSNRTVHPLGLFYWGKVWTLIGVCELRDEWRHFRLDRMTLVALMDEHFELIPGRSLQDYLAGVCDKTS